MIKYSSPLLEKRACVKCTSYEEEYDGDPPISYLCGYTCDEHPHYSNLKSFPFKKKMPCFVLDFWHSEFTELIDGTEESYDKATDLWRDKYVKTALNS